MQLQLFLVGHFILLGKKSLEGILLFIDEPEAILRPTNSLMNDDTNANNALSSFVYNSTTNS